MQTTNISRIDGRDMKKGQKHSKAIIANVWGDNHPLTSYFRVPFGCQGVDRHRKADPVGILLEGS